MRYLVNLYPILYEKVLYKQNLKEIKILFLLFEVK